MEVFRNMTKNELVRIKTDELEILSQVRERYPFMYDENGDLIPNTPDKHGYMVDESVVIEPKYIHVSQSNMFAPFINGKDIGDLIDYHLIEGYKDVYDIDKSLLPEHHTPYTINILGYFLDDVYQGCMWYYTSSSMPDYIGMYGIRSSVLNTLSGKKGIARKIICHILEMSHLSVVVPWPLHPVHLLLEKLGFKEHNVRYGTEDPVLEFLKDIAPTTNYYLYRR